MFSSTFPILTTADLPRALGFYGGLLDASVHYQFPPEGEPVYVGLHLGESNLGIGWHPDTVAGSADPKTGQRIDLIVYADDCDAAIERLRAGGAPILEEPADQPWGERMARVEDPDGNRIIIMAGL